MAAGAHFGCPKFWPFQIDTEFVFCGHFGCPKITFDRISGHLIFYRISGHFRPIRNFFLNLLTKWPRGHFGWDDNVNYRTRPRYLPRPRRGLRGIVFTRSVCLCVCVCVCVRPIFWYFISQLLEEISIWNLYRILLRLYSMHWKNWPS